MNREEAADIGLIIGNTARVIGRLTIFIIIVHFAWRFW